MIKKKILILTTSVFTDRIYQHSTFLEEIKKQFDIEIWARSYISNAADWNISDIGVKAIPVVILGGFTSVPGAIVGGLIIGVGEKIEEFKSYKINNTKGDILYLYTDGYADQFGGPKGKKFRYKALNELLQNISSKPLPQQKEILDSTFEDWKCKLEQVDDVCVIGIKL